MVDAATAPHKSLKGIDMSVSATVEAIPTVATHSLDRCEAQRFGHPDWHCLHTRPKCERDADQAMKRAGFETLFPRYQMVWRNRTKVIRPLFPCYTLVRFDAVNDPWRVQVKNHIERDVATVLIDLTTRKPFTVPDSVVEELRAQMAADGVIYPPEPRQMRRGDTGKAMTGPFASFTGICELTSKDRVTLLLNIFSRKTPVTYKREDVELVA